MADKRTDGDKQEPSLELPSFFGRRKKRRTAEPETVPAADPETAPAAEPVAPEPEVLPAPEPAPEPEPEPEPKRKSARSGPVLAPRVAAAVTGLVVGAAGTVLTYASLRGCELLRGTESCGGSGLLLLLAILVLMVLGGALLLKAFQLSDPRSTSFLGIGLTTVLVMVTVMENLFSAWMFVVVPAVCAVSYAVAHWVTTRFVEPAEQGPGVDVR
jgi:hypothetical protein